MELFSRRRAGSSSAEMQTCGSRVLSKTRYRIVVMGAAGVGKTCIISRLLYSKFLTEYKATVEELHSSSYEVNGLPITLDILDTSGTYQFPAMRRLSISTGDAFILVYSVDDQASFDEVERLRQEILDEKMKTMEGRSDSPSTSPSASPTSSPTRRGSNEIARKDCVIPLVVVGNKTDLQAQDDLDDIEDSLSDCDISRRSSLQQGGGEGTGGEWGAAMPPNAIGDALKGKRRQSVFSSGGESSRSGASSRRSSQQSGRGGGRPWEGGAEGPGGGGWGYERGRRRPSLMSATAETMANIDWGHGYVEVSAKEDINISGIFRELLAQVDLHIVPDLELGAMEGLDAQRKAKYFARLKKYRSKQQAEKRRNSCQVS